MPGTTGGTGLTGGTGTGSSKPYFTVGNPGNYVNVGSLSIWFTSKHCSGTPDQEIPDGYLGKSTVGQGSESGPVQSPNIEAFRDTCLAYYAPDSGGSPADPSNKSTLDELTKQFTTDFMAWRKLTFDISFIGILNFAQSGLVDTYELTYSSPREPCTTRIFTKPFNYKFHELGHFDYEDDCTDSDDTDKPNYDMSPFIAFYGPPAMCINGSLQLTRYKLILEDGRLVESFVSFDSVSGS